MRERPMLAAYTVAIDLVRQLRSIVEQIKMHDAHLADQLERAATNTVANLAEGATLDRLLAVGWRLTH